ncbi:MAG TPA: DUF2092 domain-containing protein [Vicinamibacterales bacterium]|nr:DUF2092 domain-containing protein [Vicinamibacterales bacterium]
MRRMLFGKSTLIPFLALSLAAVVYAQQTSGGATTKAGQSRKAQTVQSAPDLEPRAIALLKACSDRLSAAKSLSFIAVELSEQPSREGHPIAYATQSEVVLQRPNRLAVITTGDGPASEFYYDGSKVAAYAPADNLLAIADAPPTIDATLEAIYHTAGIYFPFTDLIVADPYKDMAEGLKLAYYVGQSNVVEGMTTEVVAYIDNDVFVQAWIGTEDRLPHRVRAVFLNDPEHLRHDLELSNWQLDLPTSTDTFMPTHAESATRIPFAHPHPQATGTSGKTMPAKKSQQSPSEVNP